MSVAPWSPFRELESLRDRIDRIFGSFPDGGSSMPAVDVQETDDAVIVKASMPGIKSEDISVSVDQGILSIHGESKESRDETKGTWHLVERRFGSVSRSLVLPVPVEEGKADAKLADGVLEIRLPRSTPSPKHRIAVKPAV